MSDDKDLVVKKFLPIEIGEKLPPEFFDLLDIIENGAKKHGRDSWLERDNKSLTHRANHASMCRHLAEAYCGITKDKESGKHPLLHLACRALMEYTRIKRGIDDAN